MVTIDTSKRDEFHEGPVRASEEVEEPERASEKGDYEDGSGDGLAESQDADHGELEDHETHDDAVAYHRPCSSGRVLVVVHCVEELVFVDEAADVKVDKAKKADTP